MNTINIQEGLDAINRIKLLMEYSLGKTLGENIQTLNEQNKYQQQTSYTWSTPNLATSSSKQVAEKIDAPTISELLLEAREFLFTAKGMTAQIVLSILGEPIGIPVLITILDIAIMINDFTIMLNNWKDYQGETEMEWFLYQFNNNKGFGLVCEDILFLLTGGIIKLVGKSAKAAYKTFMLAFDIEFVEKGSWMMVMKLASNKILSKLDFSKLPKKIADWCEKNVKQLKNGLELLKNPKLTTQSIKKQIPKAIGSGTITYTFMKLADELITNWKKRKDLKSLKKYLNMYYPNLFSPIKYSFVDPITKKSNIYYRDKTGSYFEYLNNKYIPVQSEEKIDEINDILFKNDLFDDKNVNISYDADKRIVTINNKKFSMDDEFNLKEIQ